MNDQGINYGIKATGEFRIKSFDKDGVLLDERHDNNLIVNTGLVHVVKRLFITNNIPDQVTYLALGGDSTAPAAGQSALVGEFVTTGDDAVPDYKRVSVTPTEGNAGVVTLAAVFDAEFSAGITEFGLFTENGLVVNNIKAEGIMFNRAVIDVINKQTLGSVSFDITISFSAGG